MLAGQNYGIINHVTSDKWFSHRVSDVTQKISLENWVTQNWIVLHKTVIPAGIINLARATADIEIAAPQFYNFYAIRID